MRQSSGKKSEKKPYGTLRRTEGRATGKPELNLLLEKTHLRVRLPPHREAPVSVDIGNRADQVTLLSSLALIGLDPAAKTPVKSNFMECSRLLSTYPKDT